MKSVIVTGANGFIGSTLIKKLLKNNIRVLAIDLAFSNLTLLDDKNLTKVESNITDLKAIVNSLEYQDFDVFYHFAWRGVNGPEKADPDIQIQNIQIAINAAKLAKMLSCKRFLCSGTIAERGLASLSHLQQTNGGMMYSAGKHSANLMLETYCKYIGLDFVWMQFSNIYGPGNRTGNLVSYTINKLSESCDAVFGPANQPYDFIYIDDLIEAVYRLGITKTKQCFYFIGSGRPRILKEYLFEIGELMNKKEKIRIGQRVDDGILYTEDMFDIAPLVSEIGHYVRNSFSVGIRKTIEDYY